MTISSTGGPAIVAIAFVLGGAALLCAADWPQWRGPARDGRGAALPVRAVFPEKLTPAWKVPVGEGHASPVVVGERVFVFAREGESEVVQRPGSRQRQASRRPSLPGAVHDEPGGQRRDGRGTEVDAGRGGRAASTPSASAASSPALDATSGRVVWRKSRELRLGVPGDSPLYGVAAPRRSSTPGRGDRARRRARRWRPGGLTPRAEGWSGRGRATARLRLAGGGDVGGVGRCDVQSESFLVGRLADRGSGSGRSRSRPRRSSTP